MNQDYCVSTHNSHCLLENCKFHLLLIVSTFDRIHNVWVKFISLIKLLVVFTLFYSKFGATSSTGEVVTNLNALFITTCNGKQQKKCQLLQRKACCTKKLKVLIYVLTRISLPHKLLVQHFWKEILKYKTQNLDLIFKICLKKSTVQLMFMDL